MILKYIFSSSADVAALKERLSALEEENTVGFRQNPHRFRIVISIVGPNIGLNSFKKLSADLTAKIGEFEEVKFRLSAMGPSFEKSQGRVAQLTAEKNDLLARIAVSVDVKTVDIGKILNLHLGIGGADFYDGWQPAVPSSGVFISIVSYVHWIVAR